MTSGNNYIYFNKGSIDGYIAKIIKVAPSPVVCVKKTYSWSNVAFRSEIIGMGDQKNTVPCVQSQKKKKKELDLRRRFLSHGL